MSMEPITIPAEAVFTRLVVLDVKECIGPDQIHPRGGKTFADILSLVMASLFLLIDLQKLLSQSSSDGIVLMLATTVLSVSHQSFEKS